MVKGAPTRESASNLSLKEKGTETILPSNSGIATCQATSSGESPASDSSHAPREEVVQMPCTTGTPSPSSAGTSHSSQPSGPSPLIAPQRVAVDGKGVRPRPLQRLDERVHEGCVAPKEVRPVEDHADRGTTG